MPMLHVVLELGNLSAADVWARKMIEAFREIDFASNRHHGSFSIEVGVAVWATLPIFVMIDRLSVVADITEAAGFMWDDDAGFELFFPAFKAVDPPSIHLNSWRAHLKLD